MNAETLSAIMGQSMSMTRYQQLLPAYQDAMRQAGINTVRRAAMFAAQLGHESVGLSALEEYASGAAYEGRADLGNTQPGDGVRFKGRGAIMITGRANYANLSRWAHQQGIVPTATYFVDNPKQLQSNRYAFVGAIWYWTVARPTLNAVSDAGDVVAATRLINGGTNGLADRQKRYTRAIRLGANLLPTGDYAVTEKVLKYSRDQVTQDTFYNCGPASVQTIVRSKTGRLFSEGDIGRRLGTHVGGTDYIGQFPTVLNHYMPGAAYAFANMPNDPPTAEQKRLLWQRIVSSIDSGYGVVANIVAPPSNYPRAVSPSTISPAYRGGTVYHYFAVMGYAGAGAGRRVWVADSGFSPYGYWLGFDQLATLIPPKGYAYSTVVAKKPAPKPPVKTGENTMNKLDQTRLRLILEQLAGADKAPNELPTFKGLSVDVVLKNAKTKLKKHGTITPVEALFLIGEETLRQYMEGK